VSGRRRASGRRRGTGCFLGRAFGPSERVAWAEANWAARGEGVRETGRGEERSGWARVGSERAARFGWEKGEWAMGRFGLGWAVSWVSRFGFGLGFGYWWADRVWVSFYFYFLSYF